jgi:outer membrane murein-binding lipoprotein Lpp
LAEQVQHWELFGYDTRKLGSHWRAAWRALLRGQDSPVRRRLDEPVELILEDGATRCYQAGAPSPGNSARCSAVLLPESLVLARELTLPRAVEDELDAVLALEVRVHSPFPEQDTAWGWTLLRREPDTVAVQLAIASRASVMAFLARKFDVHDPSEREVWAAAGTRMIIISGFGEAHREALYGKRLARVALRLAAAVLLVLLLAGAATGLKQAELRRVQAMAAATESRAADLSAMRSSLLAANESVTAVNSVMAAYPNPHLEVARLSALLDDDTYVEHIEMTGNTINLRGKAKDAAAVMKRLTDEPAYARVEAPRAISAVRGTDLEQFHLEITLAGSAQ